jgi:hypothetical protein
MYFPARYFASDDDAARWAQRARAAFEPLIEGTTAQAALPPLPVATAAEAPAPP